MPRLPEGARHAPQSIDLGLLVDFGFCAIALAVSGR